MGTHEGTSLCINDVDFEEAALSVTTTKILIEFFKKNRLFCYPEIEKQAIKKQALNNLAE